MSTPLLSENDRAEVLRMYTEMKSSYDALDAQIKTGKSTGETLAKIEKIDASLTEMHQKYTALAERQDLADRKAAERSAQTELPKSIGQQVIADAGFLAFVKSGSRGSHTVQLATTLWEQKDITGLGALLPVRIDVVGVPARLPIGVRSLVPQGRTNGGAVQYVEETSFTNNAAVVAEGAAKPKSDKVFTPKTLPVETIAHYFKISRQSYEDLPFVAAQIESNGIYGVKKVEDNQLLNGSGVSPQLKGFNTVATAAPAPTGTGAHLVDAIGAAVFDLAAKGYMADGAVVNPANWGTVAMMKGLQGNYLFANPIDYSPSQRIWGVRLVNSVHQATGTFLVGAFEGHSLLLDREEVNVQVATQSEDDFIKNMLTILVEERLVLLIYVAAAFEKGVVPAPAVAGQSTQQPTL